MLLFDLLSWWYGRGWIERLQDVQIHVASWGRFFSLGTLLTTLFQPWKQITASSGPNGGLAAKQNAFLDNLVSRFVGFFVRSSVFVFGVIVMASVLVINALFVLIWPLLPIAPLIVVILGISI